MWNPGTNARLARLARAALVALICVVLYSGAAFGASETFFGPCASNCSTRVGQVVFGGFFPLHEWNYTNNSCSANFQPEGGFQRMEAMRWAMEKYRGSLDVGYDLRDSCSKDTNTRDEALDYINVGTNCQTRYRDHPISLVIGSSSSEVSSDLASLLALFDVPQISYAATSNELNETANRDQARFSKFFRTVPPDRFQVEAMISLIERFKWQFVTVVYSNDLYGQSAYDWLLKRSKDNDVSFCLAGKISIDSQGGTKDGVEKAAKKLNKEWVANATVVIVIAHGGVVRQFFEHVDMTTERIWIASDAWSSSTPVVSRFPELTRDRVISFQPFTEAYPDFNQHLCCTPFGNFPSGARQTWYKSYFEYLFNGSNFNSTTTANQSPKFNIDANVPFVIQAVEIGLQAVNRTIMSKCGNSSICANVTSVNGAIKGAALSEVLMTSMFTNTFDPRSVQYGNDSRTFLHTSGEKFRYTIHLYRSDGANASFVKVGDWKSTGSKLTLTDAAFVANFSRIESFCARNCTAGSIQDPSKVTDPSFRPGCCWSCTSCKRHEYASNDTCKKCAPNESDDGKRTGCVELEHQYLKWGDALSVVMLVMTGVAVIITTFTIVIFYKNWETPLVRASSRELTICLFIGFYVGCCISIVYITKPTFATCILRRFGLGFSLTLCLSALLVKTNRISRVFSREPGHSRPAYVGQWWQIAFTCGLTLIQVLICIVWLVVQPAEAIVFVTTENVNVQLKCKEGNSAGFFVSLLYILVLMVVNTIYGFRTRKIPENFNEARYISFSMYTICTVWVGSIPAYFAANVAFESGLLGLPLVISILSMVGFLFVPKLYVILFDPARNTRHNLRPESTQKSRSRGRSSNNTGTGTGTGGSTPASGSGGGSGGMGGSQSGKPRARTNL